MTHIPAKTNKAGVSVPRIKTIYGLANVGDGNTKEPRPRVAHFGAGPKNVEFWLKASQQSSSGAAPAPKPSSASKAGGKKGRGQKAAGAKEETGGGGPPAGDSSAGGGRYITVADYFMQSKISLFLASVFEF